MISHKHVQIMKLSGWQTCAISSKKGVLGLAMTFRSWKVEFITKSTAGLWHLPGLLWIHLIVFGSVRAVYSPAFSCTLGPSVFLVQKRFTIKPQTWRPFAVDQNTAKYRLKVLYPKVFWSLVLSGSKNRYNRDFGSKWSTYKKPSW